jgi:uncharacterized protein
VGIASPALLYFDVKKNALIYFGTKIMRYIYLHGFASSPNSYKAQDLVNRFAEINIKLETPDLNAGDFSHLTITRQINQVTALFPNDATPLTLIGSSLGGLTAAYLAQKNIQVQRLVLLAPAFGFLSHWLPTLGEKKLQLWQEQNSLMVYHYGEQRELSLHYDFLQDANLYREEILQRPVPTLILHGTTDEVIPINASRDFAKFRPWVRLVELEDDHFLGKFSLKIWQAIQEFCELP